jgi:hypothetical protein
MELRPGYKQTEVGVIPEDWDLMPLGMVTSDIGDGIHATPVYSAIGDYYFINGNNLRNGRIVITGETKTVDSSEFKKHRIALGDRSIRPCQLKQPRREIRPGLTVGNPADLRTGCNRSWCPKRKLDKATSTFPVAGNQEEAP